MLKFAFRFSSFTGTGGGNFPTPCTPGAPESIAQSLLAAYDIREEARVTGPEWAGDSGAIMEREHVESLFEAERLRVGSIQDYLSDRAERGAEA